MNVWFRLEWYQGVVIRSIWRWLCAHCPPYNGRVEHFHGRQDNQISLTSQSETLLTAASSRSRKGPKVRCRLTWDLSAGHSALTIYGWASGGNPAFTTSPTLPRPNIDIVPHPVGHCDRSWIFAFAIRWHLTLSIKFISISPCCCYCLCCWDDTLPQSGADRTLTYQWKRTASGALTSHQTDALTLHHHNRCKVWYGFTGASCSLTIYTWSVSILERDAIHLLAQRGVEQTLDRHPSNRRQYIYIYIYLNI